MPAQANASIGADVSGILVPWEQSMPAQGNISVTTRLRLRLCILPRRGRNISAQGNAGIAGNALGREYTAFQALKGRHNPVRATATRYVKKPVVCTAA